jgi:hypothetical protein
MAHFSKKIERHNPAFLNGQKYKKGVGTIN